MWVHPQTYTCLLPSYSSDHVIDVLINLLRIIEAGLGSYLSSSPHLCYHGRVFIGVNVSVTAQFVEQDIIYWCSGGSVFFHITFIYVSNQGWIYFYNPTLSLSLKAEDK